MKKALRKSQTACWHFVKGKKFDGYHDNLTGDVSDLRGDVSGLSGYVSDLRGDIDDCNLSGYERAKGIDVADLIG